MNLMYRVIILAIGLAFLPLTAWCGNDGWYVAADAGQSRFSGIGTYGNPISPESFGYTGTGYRFSVGYQFDPYWGVEAGYVHLGQVTGNNTVIGTPYCGIICAQSFDVSAVLKTHGWELEVIGTYPFNDRWAMYVRAGGIKAYSELSAYYTPIPPYNFTFYPPTTSETSTDFDATYGLGVRWLFADHWAVRLSWDRYVSMGYNLTMGTFNVGLAELCLNLVYKRFEKGGVPADNEFV